MKKKPLKKWTTKGGIIGVWIGIILSLVYVLCILNPFNYGPKWECILPAVLGWVGVSILSFLIDPINTFFQIFGIEPVITFHFFVVVLNIIIFFLIGKGVGWLLRKKP